MTVLLSGYVSEVRGCKIALKRGGTGPSLLYLHGAGGAAAVQPFMQDLARDFFGENAGV
ncbi:MAG: hypothetical protein HY848_19890 [Betaproteobacteria bacterium]|nr:hypothetical protein [Betaproteobacteria bacterium]